MSPAKFGWQVKLWFFGTIHRDNIGTFTDGPFNPNEDPIGAMITFVGCAPGNETTNSIHFQGSFLTFIQSQDIASARIIHKKSLMLGHSFSMQFKICVQDTSSTGHLPNMSLIYNFVKCLNWYYLKDVSVKMEN